MARLLHRWSRRRAQLFVALNCGALPEALLESELFGHEAGAFTGADRKRVGRIEHANGGTLFLDEIEVDAAGVQVKLLRVLETRERRADRRQRRGRSTCASSRRRKVISSDGRHGEFREDLFYRLNVVALRIPPLRERRERYPAALRAFPQARRRALRPAGARS